MSLAKRICTAAALHAALALIALTGGCVDIDVGPDNEDQAASPAKRNALAAQTVSDPQQTSYAETK